MPTPYGAEFRQDVIDVARKGEAPLARRRISFSCSNNRFRFFNSRISADSATAGPARDSLRSAIAIQRLSVVTDRPKSFAICAGWAGSHADYVRVPYADQGAFVVPDGVDDMTALFASDAAPTGWTGADQTEVMPGDVVAVWGAGGVGQMAAAAAQLMGAERVMFCQAMVVWSWRKMERQT